MAKPPDCHQCNKPATIHLTQIVNNQIKKLDFCEDCPHQKGVTDPEGFSLAELLANGPLGGKQGAAGGPVCPSCGQSLTEFRRTGRLGCADCYPAFQEVLTPMLETMHRGSSHLGKVPQRMQGKVHRQRELERLRRDLELAVNEERFEDAARFRDELKSLRELLGAGVAQAEAEADKGEGA